MRLVANLLTLVMLTLIGLGWTGLAHAAPAESEFAVVWNFPAPGGRTPEPSLFSRTLRGALYGTTLFGGPDRHGSVFKLEPASVPGGTWKMSTLWNFTGQGAAYPRPGLIDVSPRGELRALYGTTATGGNATDDGITAAPVDRGVYVTTPAGNAKGAGTVFQLTPNASNLDWTLSTLHSFAGPDGARPNGALVSDASGAVYGTTAYGGAHGQGTVFKLTPVDAGRSRWTETVLYSFAGDDGAHPNGGLVSDATGSLYGTTFEGGRGAGAQGTVFKLTPPRGPDPHWSLTLLHSFSGADGGFPMAAPRIDQSGVVWSTTSAGGAYGDGGVVFKLTPPSVPNSLWTLVLLRSFEPYTTDGVHPTGGLVLDASAAVYGTAFIAAGFGGGIYKLTPPTDGGTNWALTILRSLEYDDGQKPVAGLISDGAGALYGTTSVGGQDEGGTIFRLLPAATANK